MMHLNSAELMGTRVKVIWSDGVVEEFPTVWLLHAWTCSDCGLLIKVFRNLKLTDKENANELKFKKKPG